MKKFLIILLLPLIVFTQDSWLTIEFSFDNYAENVGKEMPESVTKALTKAWRDADPAIVIRRRVNEFCNF